MKVFSMALLIVALTATVHAQTGVGRSGNFRFEWTAGPVKNGLVEIWFAAPVPLQEVQIERLRQLPTGPIVRADGIASRELFGLTLALNGSFEEALAQANRAVPGLTLRVVPEKVSLIQ